MPKSVSGNGVQLDTPCCAVRRRLGDPLRARGVGLVGHLQRLGDRLPGRLVRQVHRHLLAADAHLARDLVARMDREVDLDRRRRDKLVPGEVARAAVGTAVDLGPVLLEGWILASAPILRGRPRTPSSYHLASRRTYRSAAPSCRRRSRTSVSRTGCRRRNRTSSRLLPVVRQSPPKRPARRRARTPP